jgi:hypothetical protein
MTSLYLKRFVGARVNLCMANCQCLSISECRDLGRIARCVTWPFCFCIC